MQHECPPEENIVRAYTTANWDEGENRFQASYFKSEDGGLSVSRPAVLPLSHLLAIFKNELTTPTRMVLGMAEINIGDLQAIGRSYQKGVELTVEPKPTDTNPAHAEIPQRITRGLSNEIIKHLKRIPAEQIAGSP